MSTTGCPFRMLAHEHVASAQEFWNTREYAAHPSRIHCDAHQASFVKVMEKEYHRHAIVAAALTWAARVEMGGDDHAERQAILRTCREMTEGATP